MSSYTKRIKINGNKVSKDFLVAFIAENKIHIEKIKPSFFELTVNTACSILLQLKIRRAFCPCPCLCLHKQYFVTCKSIKKAPTL